jgi:hypothetical protein
MDWQQFLSMLILNTICFSFLYYRQDKEMKKQNERIDNLFTYFTGYTDRFFDELNKENKEK